jgi:hypothetical protein
MRRRGRGLILAALLSGLVLILALQLRVDSASAKSQIFSYSSQPSTTQAGGHPDIVSEFFLGNRFSTQPMPPCGCDDPKDVILHSPAGVIANPHVVSICTAAEAALFSCSADAQVGYIVLKLFGYGVIPIYRTVPMAGQAGLFVFMAPLGTIPEYISFSARTDTDYGLDVETLGISHLIPFDYYAPVIWGVPGSHENDYLRFIPGEQLLSCDSNPIEGFLEGFVPSNCLDYFHEPELVTTKQPASTSIPIKPLIQNPTTCTGPLTSSMETLAYDREKDFAQRPWPATTGCDLLSFNPSLSANPTTTETDTASGLDVKLDVPQFQDPSTPSPSEIRSTTVTLPSGFSINPNAADGKTSCSDTEARLDTREAGQCPEFAKVGTVELDSAALPGPIPGAIYLGEPKAGDRYRLLLTVFGFGTAVKIPGSVHPDPQTGQLVVSFQNLPQAPFQEFDMHFFGSERGLLATPTQCGTYPVQTTFTPWDSALSEQTSTQFFDLSSGPNGSPCPNGPRPFSPGFEAGVENNTAARHSALGLRLTRSDGEQNLSALNVSTPPGLLATLKGIPYCPESALHQLTQAGYTGLAESASPACSATSQIGTASTSEGAGTRPLTTPGRVYLAGPYKGAPLSLVVVVPAVSGPYDLGNVVVRTALRVDETSAQVSAISDPIPTILEGIPLRIRSILIKLDRPGFTLNPTNCAPFSVAASVFGTEAGDYTAGAPFQVANCSNLEFGPKLSLKLSGKTKRTANPALQAVLTAREGEANISQTVVTLPPSELLDNSHIKNVCTRVQFAANGCPSSSVYGHASVTTPLLGQPLEGPVYLRSSTHELPDLVADLRGQIHIVLAGHIDSVKGGLRASFETVPDAPVTRFTLTMLGGKQGLIENGEGVCSPRNKAKVKMIGQNGMLLNTRVKLASACGSKARHKKHTRRHGPRQRVVR